MTAKRPETLTGPDPATGAPPQAGEPPVLIKKKFDWRPVWMVGPPLLILAVIIGYPILRAIYLSFVGDPGLDPDTGKFTDGEFGTLQHYIFWLTQTCSSPAGGTMPCAPGNISTDFWPAMRNTAMFTVVTVSIETVLGFWMAVIMGRNIWGRALLRAAVLVPWAIPTAVTAKLWAFIFAPEGIANSLLGRDISWTTDPFYSKVAVILADVWKTTPFMALLILAGLQMIPRDVYEAARVDGATKWQQFTKITLPLVRPALMVAILFRTLDALRMYDLPVILISPNSSSPTATISQLVVNEMRTGPNSASALSTLVFLLIFAVAFVMVKWLGANVVEERTGKKEEVR
ncbi:MAG TPA: sugar ABC transporter permease [Candidatus Dietzia merdigallinarum]|nr:sugar ABC transporter permease [Candidatus Dietzia merdigallinarum]